MLDADRDRAGPVRVARCARGYLVAPTVDWQRFVPGARIDRLGVAQDLEAADSVVDRHGYGPGREPRLDLGCVVGCNLVQLLGALVGRHARLSFGVEEQPPRGGKL